MILTYVVYGGVLFFSTFFLYLADKVKRKTERNILFVLSFLMVFFVAAIRYNVGSDYPSYAWLFYEFQAGGGKYIEVGYRLLNIAIYEVGLGFKGFVFFLSFITYFVFYKSYPKEKAYIFHFVFLCTLYLYSLSNFRSSLVYGIMFIAVLKYIDNKKLLPFLGFVFISTLFHISAVVYLLIPLVFTEPIKRIVDSKYIPEIILLALVILALKADLLRDLFFFNPVSEILGFSSYANSEKWGGDASVGSGLGVFGSLLAPSIFIFFRRHLISKNEKMIYVVILSLFYIFLVDLSLATKIAARLKYLFVSVNILIVYYLAVYLNRKNQVLVLTPVFLFLILVFFKTIHDSNVDKFRYHADGSDIKVSPYVTIFNKKDSTRPLIYID